MPTVEERVQRAIEAFEGLSREQYLNCAQAVIKALGDLTPIEEKTLIKIGTGFGGGFAGMGETCGALTGGIMLLSAKFGVLGDEPYKSFKKQKTQCKKLVREYYNWFKNQNGALNCSDLIKIDTRTDDGVAHYTDLKQAHNVPCYKVIEDSVKKLFKTLIR